MDVGRFLRPRGVRCAKAARSKKHALELLSEVLSECANGCTSDEILEALMHREKLGCTGLGGAVAMPHSRVNGIADSVGAFLRLDVGVEFDSADGVPVDLIFGLLVPEHFDESELEDVRELIEKLADPALQSELRNANSSSELYNLLTDSLTKLYRRLES